MSPACPELLQDLPYLETLDAFRRRARELRNTAIRDLLDRSAPRADDSRAPRVRWEESTSALDTILLRRAKHIAFSLGLLPDESTAAENLFQPLPTVSLSPISDGSLHLNRGSDQAVPVLEATALMRARLDELRGSVPKEIHLCFYHIVRELYFVDTPDWALGGARASSTPSAVSTFVTSECSRSLGYLARMLGRSAVFLREVVTQSGYVSRIISDQGEFRLPDAWCNVELDRVATSIRAMLQDASGRVLFDVRDLDINRSKSCADLLRDLRKRVGAFVTGTTDDLKSAINEIETYRADEEALVQKLKPAAEADPRLAQEARRADRALTLSRTAHDHACRALTNTRDDLDRYALSVPYDFGEANDLAVSRLATLLDTFASGLRNLLQPVAVFIDGKLRATVQNYRSHRSSSEIQDMAFAAVCSGEIGRRWEDPIYSEALSLLAGAIDESGLLPKGHPFHVSADGAERHVANAHVLHAIAQLAQHVPAQLDTTLIDRFLRHFEASALPGHAAWRRPDAGLDAVASPWASALAIAALHRLIKTLDIRLNLRLAAHFTVRSSRLVGEWIRPLPAKPKMHDLMCSDLGLTCVNWGRKRRSILHLLELMRAGMHGPKVHGAADPSAYINSLILYGPPGTGKTTLARALAATSGHLLVELSPGDLLVDGAEGVERRARAAMRALCMFTRAVILFDEFDTFLRTRDDGTQRDGSVFEFLTGGMLPKLADLHRAATDNGLVYIMATNHIGRLDDAAIRPGRFDAKAGVYPPDVGSRICRLVSQVRSLMTLRPPKPGFERRIITVVARTANVPISVLCRPGWFTAPAVCATFGEGTPFRYIFDGGAAPDFPVPVSVKAPNGRVADRHSELALEEEFEKHVLFAWDEAARNYEDTQDATLPGLISVAQPAEQAESAVRLFFELHKGLSKDRVESGRSVRVGRAPIDDLAMEDVPNSPEASA
jgi:hypothetical protein